MGHRAAGARDAAARIASDPDLFRVLNMGHEASPRTSPRRGRCIYSRGELPTRSYVAAISKIADSVTKG